VKKTVTTVCALLITLAACGSSNSSQFQEAQQLCTNASNCGMLQGETVANCVDSLNKCLGLKTASNQQDWTQLADECLKFSACSAVTCAKQGFANNNNLCSL